MSATPIILAEVLKALTPRVETAHKHDFGHVCVIGGNWGMAGAPQMAARAALRSGAGLVTVATRPLHAHVMATAQPEVMAHPVETQVQLTPLLKRATILALGPGLGQDAWAQALYEQALTQFHGPCVLDADALNLLAKQARTVDNCVLTPHMGEAARLLTCDMVTIQADRDAAIMQLHAQYGGVIILKGARTLVYDGHNLKYNTTGNPGMATAGMGDVLTGIIAGLLAQGLSNFEAACLAVGLHGKAGDIAAQFGQRGLLATDLLPEVRALLN